MQPTPKPAMAEDQEPVELIIAKARAAWNAEADDLNQWSELSDDEKCEIVARAAIASSLPAAEPSPAEAHGDSIEPTYPEVRALIAYLKQLEDPMQEAVPSVLDADWRALAGKCWRGMDWLLGEVDSLEDAKHEAERAPWPDWANQVLKVVREFSGYDGYDDADGVDIVEEVGECLRELAADAERARDALAASKVQPKGALNRERAIRELASESGWSETEARKVVDAAFPAPLAPAPVAQQDAAQAVAWQARTPAKDGKPAGSWGPPFTKEKVKAALAKEDYEIRPLYADPPDPQAQPLSEDERKNAARKPLTEEQIVNDGLMMCPTNKLDSCADAFEAGVKFAEAAHGITSAQAEGEGA